MLLSFCPTEGASAVPTNPSMQTCAPSYSSLTVNVPSPGHSQPSPSAPQDGSDDGLPSYDEAMKLIQEDSVEEEIAAAIAASLVVSNGENSEG